MFTLPMAKHFAVGNSTFEYVTAGASKSSIILINSYDGPEVVAAAY
jgi:hypothetical protein